MAATDEAERTARRLGAALGLALALLLFALPAAADLEDPMSSRRVQWIRPDGAERADLDRWVDGVGPELVFEPHAAPQTAGGVDALPILVWNANLGAGAVPSLLADLRSGGLTDGRPVEHFVLLLQEVHRGGRGVPATPPSGFRSGRAMRKAPADGERLGIDEVARREDLYLYYVPSMRNGDADGRPEDRGNGILSTLPLFDFVAMELPLERQRRVAIAADVRGTTTDGEKWQLQLVNLHLDNRSPWRRFHKSFGAGRARQARWLLEALGDEGPAVVGGDFNSWVAGAGEPAVELVRSRYPAPRALPEAATHTAPVVRRILDHVFFRLEVGWNGRSRVLTDAYGSDHRPLLAWVELSGS